MKLCLIQMTVGVGLCLAAVSGGAQPVARPRPAVVDLTELSLEQLMNIKVTSVSRKAEKYSTAPAAIYVITAEDIRRSGVTSLPEALRMAPGLQVARLDAHNWAISSRGFNDLFANKLLVLIDGRSVYTPWNAGVFWDVQDVMLEDLDRIEVIRGPGATLWGANAVNGVININTKRASESQGMLLTGGGGTEEQGFGGVRYGGRLGENVYYRVYGKYFNRDDSVLPTGAAANDRWDTRRGGFRVDWERSAQDLLTLQGDIYAGEFNQTFFVATPGPPFAQALPSVNHFSGGNLLGRWTHTFGEASDLQLQWYYDRTTQDLAIVREDRDTFDLDLQHRFPVGDRNDIVWGLDFRMSRDDERNGYTFSHTPASRTTHLISGFVLDEITLVPDRLKLTVGSKFERNDFTGFEVQPNARLQWTPLPQHTLWASASRAVRTPSRAEHDAMIRQPGPVAGTVLAITGSRNFDSEELRAYELGYRVQPHARVSVDVAAFYNEYDRLRTLDPGAPIPSLPPVVIPVNIGNQLRGETYGVELAPSWQATDWWRLQAAYTFLKMQLHLLPGSTDPVAVGAERRSPQQQFSLRSSMDLTRHWELDCAVRYVDRLPAFNISSYVALDLRLAWKPSNHWEISLVGQNLLDQQHPEFGPSTIIRTQATEVERSVHGQVTWRF